MVEVRNGKIDVVLFGIGTIGEAVELGDKLHLFLHFLGIGVAAGGEDEKRQIRVCLDADV